MSLLGVGKKKTLFSFISPITVFICLWADFNSAQQQVCVCVCVWCSNESRAAGPPKCPSIHLTHTCTHTSCPRWRSSSQCHFQFGWAHGLLRRYNGLDDGREMDDAVQVPCNKHSHFWSSHSSGAIVHSLDLTVFHDCIHLKSPKLWKKYSKVGATYKNIAFL